MNVDTYWYLRVNSWAASTPSLHRFMAEYAAWGGLTLLAALLVALWWWARGRPELIAGVVLTGVSTLAALVVNQQVLSPLIARARPCQVIPGAEVLLGCSADFSMPSDHCIIAGAFAAGLWLLHRGVGASAVFAAVLVAFSRVYVGVHYPLDTVVGLGAGACVALVLQRLAGERATRLVGRAADTRCRMLVARGPRTRSSLGLTGESRTGD